MSTRKMLVISSTLMGVGVLMLMVVGPIQRHRKAPVALSSPSVDERLSSTTAPDSDPHNYRPDDFYRDPPDPYENGKQYVAPMAKRFSDLGFKVVAGGTVEPGGFDSLGVLFMPQPFPDGGCPICGNALAHIKDVQIGRRADYSVSFGNTIIFCPHCGRIEGGHTLMGMDVGRHRSMFSLLKEIGQKKHTHNRDRLRSWFDFIDRRLQDYIHEVNLTRHTDMSATASADLDARIQKARQRQTYLEAMRTKLYFPPRAKNP